MGRRGVGLGFIFIAAFLWAARYVTAAIFGSGTQTWSADLFASMLQYAGGTLGALAGVSLAVGILYLILAEVRR